MRSLVLVLVISVFTFAQSTFSNPQPTFENPRKIMIQLYDSELNKVNHNISSIYNILKEYPSETVKIAVIAYGNGIRALKKDYDEKTLIRIQSLMEYDVEFIICKNTMESMKWDEKDFIDDVSYVQAGLVELVERQIDGYIGILAY